MKNLVWKVTVTYHLIHLAYVEWHDDGDTWLHALALAIWTFVPMTARW